MARKHTLLISLAIAGALVAGVFAAVRTTGLGASTSAATQVSDRQLRARDHQLDRIARRIKAQSRKRPPKLPELRLPDSSANGTSRSTAGAALSDSAPAVMVAGSGPGSDDGHETDDHGGDSGRHEVEHEDD